MDSSEEILRVEITDPEPSFRETLRGQATILGAFVILIWFLEAIDLLILSENLDNLGVRPRTLGGLWGILFMPFLHSGIGHVLANTVPFIMLGWLVMLRRTADFFLVSAVVILVSGLGTWLVGQSNSTHLGASGLVFGYFGYLLMRAWFERSLKAISMALIVVLLYGGLIWGVLPLMPGISWQAHLFGFVGGAIAARQLSERGGSQEEYD